MATVTLSTAENALKSLYLDVVAEQLNMATNPFYARIKASSHYVSGKDVVKLARVGMNGGIGAGTEADGLPQAAGSMFKNFVAPLKNLYGQIEISDKAILASRNSEGAFVNLLNDELESLLKASKFNFSRMLYGDGSGVLTLTKAGTDVTLVEVADVKNLAEGMVIDIVTSASNGTPITGGAARRIVYVDRANKEIQLDGVASVTVTDTNAITMQGSFGKELSGLGAIFGSSASLYGLTRDENKWMTPYTDSTMSTIDEIKMQKAIDTLEETAGSVVDFIVCSSGVRRAYQDYMSQTKRNVNTLDLEGGFKAISYNGIPVYADRFCPAGTMYLLDTTDFALHQLCDWRWLEDASGRVLRQVAGTPKFTATLVKYAELLCECPAGQAKLTDITEG